MSKHLCPFCPCVFETDIDLQLHLNAFGKDPKQHRLNIERAKERAEREQRFRKVLT